MNFERASFPPKEICQHIAIGLDVLARHMELQPHLFRVQLDHAAVLPRLTIEALRDDFVSASRIKQHHGQLTDFFFEDERHSLQTALLALDEYRDNLGDALVLEGAHRLGMPATAMLARVTGKKLEQFVQHLPSLASPSPHRGEDYNHRYLSETAGDAKARHYPDGHKRYRIVEERDGEDWVLDSFDDLYQAEDALRRACDHDHDAYLMDGEDEGDFHYRFVGPQGAAPGM